MSIGTPVTCPDGTYGLVTKTGRDCYGRALAWVAWKSYPRVWYADTLKVYSAA